MKMEEKIGKELKKYFPVISKEKDWADGFRIGFRYGYNLAYEEATEMLKKSREKFEES